MNFSGKITNSFFAFLTQCDFDTNILFEMTQLEHEFLKDPHSWLEAHLVEDLLISIEHAYQHQFMDKDLITTVGHNCISLKCWGGLDEFLKSSFKSSREIHAKLELILSYFANPFEMYDVEEDKVSFSFQTNIDAEEYPATSYYFKSVLESLPIFAGEELTDVRWDKDHVEIFYPQEESLSLALFDFEEAYISHVKARQIIDSRGVPTLEVETHLKEGGHAKCAIPSGASTGRHEAHELRDGDKKYFFGKGVKKACENVTAISQKLEGLSVFDQSGIDSLLNKLDGTPLKKNLGANALLGISLSCLHAAAQAKDMPLYKYLNPSQFCLPVPLMNIINGGKHAMNPLSIQEFMIVPYHFDHFHQALRASCEIFHQLKQDLKEKKLSTNLGDEGGFSPHIKSEEEALNLCLNAIDKLGYSNQVGLALDCAASEFYQDGMYLFEGKRRSSKEMIKIYKKWVSDYPLISIEDGLSEDDNKGWCDFTSELGDKIQIVGDDIFVTQKARLQEGIKQGIANSLLVKCNQVGTITETWEAIDEAHQAGYTCIMSHRSGETEDTSIADLSVGWSCEQIKTGSLARGERTAKYNRLLYIEDELGKQASYKGKQAFKAFRK